MITNKEYWELDSEKLEGQIVSKGKVGGSILYKLLELCDRYFHIHIEEILYNEYGELEWIDIEGIGYGWKWLRCEDENGILDEEMNHNILVDHIKQIVEWILNGVYDNALWFTHIKTNDYEQVILYNQMNDGSKYNYVFSDKDLDIW